MRALLLAVVLAVAAATSASADPRVGARDARLGATVYALRDLAIRQAESFAISECGVRGRAGWCELAERGHDSTSPWTVYVRVWAAPDGRRFMRVTTPLFDEPPLRVRRYRGVK